MDHISVPLAQIEASLALLRRGVIDHERCDPNQVDEAVSRLAFAHTQLGGETRRSLYELFASCRPGTEPEALARSIEALAEHLRHTATRSSPTQLTLFGPPDGTNDP
jgi:hypothetical protein